jgi:cytochrome c oxidase cbb3-type subunit 3
MSSRRFATLASVLFAVGCNTAPSDLRPWRASDHDHSEPSSQQAAPSRQSTGKDTGIHGIEEVVLVAWKQNCVRCHGVIGRGDGSQGAMFKASDLTRPEWQSATDDQQIAAVIKNGRGAMPAFELPQPTIDGLVRLIRLLKTAAQRSDAGAPRADAGAPGATSARPSGTLRPDVGASGAASARAPGGKAEAAPPRRPAPADATRTGASSESLGGSLPNGGAR